MKKYLCKGSILLPILMIHLVLMDLTTLTIPELGLYLGWGAVTFLYITFSILWLCCSPLKESCCKGGWTELLFNAFPGELLSMLIFAQWHFTAAVLLTVIMLVFQLAVVWLVKKDEWLDDIPEKKRRRYNRGLHRFTVLTTAVFCAIPCFLTIFVYELKSPTYAAEEELLDSMLGEGGEAAADGADPYEANHALLRNFKERTWDGLDVQERITLAQALVDFESRQLGVPTIRVTADTLGGFTVGSYDTEQNEMTIDVVYLASVSAEECIDTICHETFHSAQTYLTDNIDWEETVFQAAYFQELRQWRDNAENYMRAGDDGFDAYKNQPLEVSARAYAAGETEKILSYIEP